MPNPSRRGSASSGNSTRTGTRPPPRSGLRRTNSLRQVEASVVKAAGRPKSLPPAEVWGSTISISSDPPGRGCGCRISTNRYAVPVLRPAGRLEKLDRVARRVVEDDLRPSRSGDDVAAERYAGTAQAIDLRLDVLDDQMDPVPAAGTRLAAVRHRPPSRARRPAQQQPQGAAAHVREVRRRARDQAEAEVARVERDRSFDVIDQVADVDGLVAHGASSPRPPGQRTRVALTSIRAPPGWSGAPCSLWVRRLRQPRPPTRPRRARAGGRQAVRREPWPRARRRRPPASPSSLARSRWAPPRYQKDCRGRRRARARVRC